MSAPDVGVVLPTRDRPELLRAALSSVRAQEYDGPVRCLVVYDGTPPDHSLADDSPDRPVEVLTNTRTPGLAGARNTGIRRLDTELVAFCDDDDEWRPGKLAAQAGVLAADRAVELCCTGIEVAYAEERVPRLAGTDRVTLADLLRSRMSMLHSSSVLVRRNRLEDGIGLIEEDLPGSYAEDWDLLLRAARRHPVAVVDRPLVRVLWGGQSYFASRWRTIVEALEWMRKHHPDLDEDRRGSALIQGKLAFAYAALGVRAAARQHALAALRRYPAEPRAYLALAVAARLVSADGVMKRLNARGRSI